MGGDEISLIYFTADRKNAKEIARTLVAEKLAACCNITPIESVYRWEGKIEEAEECAVVAKTIRSAERKLIKRLLQIHTYTIPAILSIKTGTCEKKYLRYLKESVSD